MPYYLLVIVNLITGKITYYYLRLGNLESLANNALFYLI
jgi:hypothetical protein